MATDNAGGDDDHGDDDADDEEGLCFIGVLVCILSGRPIVPDTSQQRLSHTPFLRK